MYLRGNPRYPDYPSLWREGYRSPYFQAKPDPQSEEVDWALSERQLLVQSNGRTMLGQDARGRLHFVCTPHEEVYAIPSGSPNVGGQFGGHIGQFYQTDVALLLGKMRYELELDNGRLLDAAGEDAASYYLDHFLPVTLRERPNLITRLFSLAPIPEEESAVQSDLHPLPGPGGALYGLHLENTGAQPLRGRLHLRLDQKLVSQNEHYGRRFEDLCSNPYRAEWDDKLLVLWHPQACATIQLLEGCTGGNPDNPVLYVPFELAVGESRVFTAIVSVTPRREEAHAALGALYRHSALEWINLTGDYWRARLGSLEAEIREDNTAGQRYRDMHNRFVLDNFNCIQFDRAGRMLTNWQGAPSHCLGRTWGIDMEPNVFGVLNVVPEIGRAAIDYTLKYNLPAYSIYSDHSMLIALAPLTIAGRYLELTGDAAFFRDHPERMEKLEAVYRYLLAHKHPEKALFSSRYASDLIVFKKYDYGTNVKCFYALTLYAKIREAAGQDAAGPRELAEEVRRDLAEAMEGEGPFGRQITGGASLGEQDGRFYIQEDMLYYGGEDSATSLAPIYGLYEFDHGPYANLNRYARSLFIPNYDLEFQTLRELHYGMNPSATGAVLRLGGSLTRAEMEKSLNIVFDRLDDTASLFWWPRAMNKKRCLTRCSQGQGAWLQHSCDQWLGLRLDAAAGTLTLRPQGLLSAYSLKGGRVGAYTFDLEWEESGTSSRFRVRNRNHRPFRIILGVRPWGAGAEGPLEFHSCTLEAGETLDESFPARALSGGPPPCVCRREGELLAKNGLILGPYGLVMPKLYAGDCDIFLLRYALVNATDAPWDDVELELEVPEGWFAAPKERFVWEYDPVFSGRKAAVTLGRVEPYAHYTAGFFVLLPSSLTGSHNSVMLSKHMFRTPGGDENIPLELLVESEKAESCAPVVATLRRHGDAVVQPLPVRLLDRREYAAAFDKMLHG